MVIISAGYLNHFAQSKAALLIQKRTPMDAAISPANERGKAPGHFGQIFGSGAIDTTEIIFTASSADWVAASIGVRIRRSRNKNAARRRRLELGPRLRE
jgi:hypothetical protein